MVLNIPNHLIVNPKYSEEEFRVDVAVMLYQRKVLTLARAARWLSITRLQFQKALADRQVTINYSLSDFEMDLRTLDAMPPL